MQSLRNFSTVARLSRRRRVDQRPDSSYELDRLGNYLVLGGYLGGLDQVLEAAEGGLQEVHFEEEFVSGGEGVAVDVRRGRDGEEEEEEGDDGAAEWSLHGCELVDIFACYRNGCSWPLLFRHL